MVVLAVEWGVLAGEFPVAWVGLEGVASSDLVPVPREAWARRGVAEAGACGSGQAVPPCSPVDRAVDEACPAEASPAVVVPVADWGIQRRLGGIASAVRAASEAPVPALASVAGQAGAGTEGTPASSAS